MTKCNLLTKKYKIEIENIIKLNNSKDINFDDLIFKSIIIEIIYIS